MYLNGSSQLLDDLDVLQVDIGSCRGIRQNLEDGVDGDRGQLRGAALRHDLRVERGVGRLKQSQKKLRQRATTKVPQLYDNRGTSTGPVVTGMGKVKKRI